MATGYPPDEKYPARQVLLADNETIIRGIVEEEWDPETKRGSPGIFKRPNTSVTRTDAVGLQAGIALVKRDVEWSGKPARNLRGAGEITVSLLKKVGASPVPVAKPGPCIHLQVWEEKVAEKDGKPGNDQHAEIVAYDDAEHLRERSSISMGYSRMLAKALTVHEVDTDGNIVGVSPPREWAKAEQ
ncbi:hypothetical protein HU745_07295 [Pseudomonas mosselii]|uniref:hypothetical protein n=1 Tax=Pseudomonas mosselii TaxID=78327 RepID=UPI001646DA61|nr:hypothetical protein [Pseudomonas mosselii]MBC3450857.1 hypothetical protein [Pseudomonas mosselii]